MRRRLALALLIVAGAVPLDGRAGGREPTEQEQALLQVLDQASREGRFRAVFVEWADGMRGLRPLGAGGARDADRERCFDRFHALAFFCERRLGRDELVSLARWLSAREHHEVGRYVFFLRLLGAVRAPGAEELLVQVFLYPRPDRVLFSAAGSSLIRHGAKEEPARRGRWEPWSVPLALPSKKRLELFNDLLRRMKEDEEFSRWLICEVADRARTWMEVFPDRRAEASRVVDWARGASAVGADAVTLDHVRRLEAMAHAERDWNRPPRPLPPGVTADVRRLILESDRSDRGALLRQAPEVLAAMERMAPGERDEKRLLRIVHVLGWMASVRAVDRSPKWLLDLAGQAALDVRIEAVGVLARIADPPAVSWLVERLGARVGPDDEDGWAVLGQAVHVARRVHAPAVARALERIVSRGSYLAHEAIDSLGDVGDRDSLALLEKLVASSSDAEAKRRARFYAIEKLQVLTGPDRDQRLLEMIKSRYVSGKFVSYQWALDNILRLNLTNLAGPLRALYDQDKKIIVSGPGTFSAKLLDGIRRLGGRLSPEELQQLEDYGMLRR